MERTNRYSSFGAMAAASLWLSCTCMLAYQQGEQPTSQPGPPEPVVSPESPSAPASRSDSLTPEQRADIFMARKAYADAVDYYQRALNDKDRVEAGIWNKLGIAYQHMQDFDSARKAYRRAIRVKKDYAEPWNNMGTTYYLKDQPKKSLKWYRRAVKLDPNNASFHVNLGTALYGMKKIEDAIAEYRTALILDPDVFTLHSTMGTTMQARAADAKYYFYMAKVFASLDRAEEAVRYLRRAFEDGFKNFKLLDEDPDFKKLAELPAYVELRANPPQPL